MRLGVTSTNKPNGNGRFRTVTTTSEHRILHAMPCAIVPSGHEYRQALDAIDPRALARASCHFAQDTHKADSDSDSDSGHLARVGQQEGFPDATRDAEARTGLYLDAMPG